MVLAAGVLALAEAPLDSAAATWAARAARAERDTAAVELPQRSLKGKRPPGPATEVSTLEVRRLPGAMNDPVRALATTPGVQTQSDVNARPFVRGGDADMTRVILNGIPLLQPYHTGGSFSLFNLSTLESVGMYRDAFPAEYPGALSGLLRLKARTRIPETLGAQGELSLVRGDVYGEVPLFPGRLSVFGSAQSLLFADALHGALDLARASSGDSAFKAEMLGYRDHVNLPKFTDYHWGAAFAPSETLRLHYLGMAAGDDYAVVVPRETSILSSLNPNFGNPTAPVAPENPNTPKPPRPRHVNKLSVDSISAVDIGHGAHFVTGEWNPSRALLIENDFGWQIQDWDVGFRSGPGSPTPPWALSQSIRQFDWRGAGTWTTGAHKVGFGLSTQYQSHRYRMNLPWVLYDVMVNGNVDMLEPLGSFTSEGFTIAKEDSGLGNLDYLGEYPSRIRFAHQGFLEQRSGAVFASDVWTLGEATVTYGLRIQYHDLSGEVAAAPRADWRWRAGPADDFRMNAGIYAQENLPFYARDGNPGLRSEKVYQAGSGWTHRFGARWKVSLDIYGKWYEDLVVPSLVPDGTLDLDGFLLPLPDADMPAEEVAALKARLDTIRTLEGLPDSLRERAYEVFGGLEYRYANDGSGYGYGAELALDYTPTATWRGWASLDAGVSERRDTRSEAFHPFRSHRPLIFNWVNRFAFSGGYALGLAYRRGLGQAYTPFSGTGDGKGSFEPITVGARNSGRLSSYSRLDVRLSRDHRVWGRTLTTYFEVWNATNSPNYFARDAETGRLRAAHLNWPFPFLFLGVSGAI